MKADKFNITVMLNNRELDEKAIKYTREDN